MDNLQVLVLNTNLYYRTEIIIQDPCSQLSWLKMKLKEARDLDLKVVITGHVPPGFFERHYIGPFFANKGGYAVNDIFVDIINEYSDQIVAQIFGHTHTDTFKLFKNSSDASQVLNVAFMGSSITPLVGWGTGTNPGIRLYHYTPGKNHLNDFDQYYADLFAANFLGNDLDWKKLYRFTEMYQVPDLSVESMHDVYQAIWSNDETYEKAYLLNTLLHFNRKF